MTVIEAVPNVSEGRRVPVIRALADAVRHVPGVSLLDCSSDPSHNRSVLTLVGDADGLTEAVVQLYAVAIREIDLRQHRGEHPRFGAVDVLPFIPLADATAGACVRLARTVGATVAERFGLPVFFYEDAAFSPQRRALEDIRRGQFEGLADKMKDDVWTPDVGPRTPHPSAGATAIGVRGPLIAFNVNLQTDDVEIARQIARRIRARSGGLPAVKAIGISLSHRDLTQVSINLTDYRRTPIHRVFELVKHEAHELGVGITGSEIVGLVPAEALIATAVRDLQLEGFRPDQVLDARLYRAVTFPQSHPSRRASPGEEA